MTQPIDMSLKVVQTARAEPFLALRDGVAVKELGLAEATGGMFSARRVKTQGRWPVRQIANGLANWFSFIYVMEGSVTLRLEGHPVTLKAHDGVCQAVLSEATVVEASPDFEFFELQAPDEPRVRALLPEKPAALVALDAPELHEIGTGPRDFFDYRDLGLAAITKRQVEVQIIRARRARQGGTGWHSHTMSQLSYGLNGWASLGVEGRAQPVIQERGDALSIPPNCVHNADSFSHDYWVLQLQIPADYATTPASDPHAAAPQAMP